MAILANTPAQAETLLHSLERAAAGIGLHVNAHKTEYMCFNQTGDVSTLGGSSLKLVDKFTYLGNSVSSTEKYIDTRLTKARTVIDRLSVIWKSDLTDKMKRIFFQAVVVSILLCGCTALTALVFFPIGFFYCDISDCHILPPRAWTPALMSAPTYALSRKVLSLYKPKDNIYKTKMII